MVLNKRHAPAKVGTEQQSHQSQQKAYLKLSESEENLKRQPHKLLFCEKKMNPI